MNTDIIEYTKSDWNIKAKVRLDTSDSFIVKEVFGGEYNKLSISSNDVVVDFGLNIGMFSVFAAKKGAREIHSFEPELENFNLANYNIKLNGVDDIVKTYNVAVVGNNDTKRNFSINVKKNKGAHSLIEKRGRDSITVKCENINNILNMIKPTIIKMDIEGGEYECIPAIKSFDGINQLIMEFHHAHLDDIKTHDKYNEMLNFLRTKFNNVEARKDTKGAWVNIIYCYNC